MTRVRIESAGASLPAWWQWRTGSVAHAVTAGRRCLAASRRRPDDVGVLVSAGVYRDGHVAEPAIAAYIQHRLGINVEFQGRPTLSFDLLNGGCGMLNAVQVVGAMLQAGQGTAGLVVAGEANSDRRPDPASAVARSGAALLLDLSPAGAVDDAGTAGTAGNEGTSVNAGYTDIAGHSGHSGHSGHAGHAGHAGHGHADHCHAGYAGHVGHAVYARAGTGFGAFAFQTHEEDAELFTAVVSLAVPRGRLLIRRQARLEEAWLAHAAAAVDEVLAKEGLSRNEIDLLVPAQISAGFLSRLPAAIGVTADKIADFTATLPDTGSTSVFLAWQHLSARRFRAAGTRVLFLAFGSGLTVGAAIYTV